MHLNFKFETNLILKKGERKSDVIYSYLDEKGGARGLLALIQIIVLGKRCGCAQVAKY